jgi:hypothetical protein
MTITTTITTGTMVENKGPVSWNKVEAVYYLLCHKGRRGKKERP